MKYLDSQMMNWILGTDIIVRFQARDVEGRLNRKLLGNFYIFTFNENPENKNGIVNIFPIYSADKVPENSRKYFLIRKEEDGIYSFENKEK